MTLFFRSLVLSLSVFGRMIFPVLVISVASTFVWTLASIPTLGLSIYVSEPITAAFISLFGIRMALAVKGDLRRYEIGILLLKAVLFGLFFFAVNSGLNWTLTFLSKLFALWQVGDVSPLDIKDAAESTRFAFALIWLGYKTVLVILAVSVFQAIMAVPLASAAREASHREPSRGFFYGAGRCFLPLFCVFFVSVFLQIYFGFYSFLFAMIPLFLSVFMIILGQPLPELDLEMLMKGIGALAGLLWLHSWIWSASALALLKFVDAPVQPEAPTTTDNDKTSTDIRALRKSRE